MDLRVFEIYDVSNTSYKKERIGNKCGDGGYVILKDVGNYDLLLSCGVGNDITFEEEFIKKYNVNCITYDGTVEKLPDTSVNENITFHKKNIDHQNRLEDELSSHQNIFLKMDIEGAEFSWLETVSVENFINIKQCVFEFHMYTENHWNIENQRKINDLFKKINTTHALVHLHVNNCLGCKQVEGRPFPMVFECTYIRKDLMEKYDIQILVIDAKPETRKVKELIEKFHLKNM
jgi:hypothetical protein